MALVKRLMSLMLMLALPLAGWGAAPEKRTKELTEGEVLKLIELQFEDDAIIGRVNKFWVDFKVDDAVLKRLKEAGASDAVLARLRQGQNPSSADVKLADDPRRTSMALWVKRDYNNDCALQSEFRINGELVNIFSSDAEQSIGKYLKMGWNTLTVKTAVKGPEKEWNQLYFRIGPVQRKPNSDEVEMAPVLWRFDNGIDWKENGGKLVHRLGPNTREVTHTYQLYFAGLQNETGKIQNGDYVLQASQSYNATPPVIATVFVNGTPLNTFVGQDRHQLVVTPLLKKGKNEIRVIASRVSNIVEWNDLSFDLGGPAEYSPQQEKFLLKPVKQFKTMPGWLQDKKTGQWHNEAKPDSDTLERTVEFILDEEPKVNPK